MSTKNELNLLNNDNLSAFPNSSYIKTKDFHLANLSLNDDNATTIQKIKEARAIYCLLLRKASIKCKILLIEALNVKVYYVRVGLFLF
jgi:hypothetical protein